MSVRFIHVSALALAALSLDAYASLSCDPGFRAVTEDLKVSEFANDLEPLIVYENGREITLATGGMGPLQTVVNSWLWERGGQFIEQVNSLDFGLQEFDRADTDAELVDVRSDGRITMRFCLPLETQSTTIHAVFGDTVVRGVQSTVGHVRDNRINAVANRATGAWFRKLNEGRERSGSEQMLRIMRQHYGSTAPRWVAERHIIALNEMYSATLAAEHLTGGNDLNIDVEGNTVYVEGAPTRMCFSDATTAFLVDGIDRLANHCVTGLEQLTGKRYHAITDGLAKTGTIENARVGLTYISHWCDGRVGTVNVSYGEAALNIQTVFRQKNVEIMIPGQNPGFAGTCDPVTVTSSVLGNQEQPLYSRSMTVMSAPEQGTILLD